MVKIPELSELLQAGVHFGHKTSRWSPKMASYIFGERGGIHVIDLEIAVKKLEEALKFLSDIAANGGTVLFVGTKKQGAQIIREAALDAGMPYVDKRWLGGTLTNFRAIQDVLRRYLDLKSKSGRGELSKYTKKEQIGFQKEIEDLEVKVGGLVGLNKLPQAIFILDIKKEETALKEAVASHVPIVAVCDTNVDPSDVEYVIPANDDAVKSIKLIVGLVAEAIKEGKANNQQVK
jgi:small subunit ribosomal protein S2